METTVRGRKDSLSKLGGAAAIYLALAYLAGIVIFLGVLNYPQIEGPAQRLGVLIAHPRLVFWSNILLYVAFGPALATFVLSLGHRLKSSETLFSRLASVMGYIWAASLIASGMVANAGIAPVILLNAKDPEAAAATWLIFETVASGLGNGNGEILGGLFSLFVGVSALKSRRLPKMLSCFGLLIGLVGLASTLPGLSGLAGIFGLAQMLWFGGIAIVLLSGGSAKAAAA